MAKSIARTFLNVITSLGVGATLGGFVWPIFFPRELGLMILVALLIAVGHFVLLWFLRARPGDDRVSLERGSVAFATYYREFYEREGALSIFCEDTEWLEGDAMKPVVEAIAAKGARATVFLSVLGECITEKLQGRGVRIVRVREEFALAVKMSYRVNGTERDLMIRGAGDGTTSTRRLGKKAKEVNTFTRTQNQDMINLAQAIFSALEKPGAPYSEMVYSE